MPPPWDASLHQFHARVRSPRCCDELLRFAGIVRGRLLEQNVLACLERRNRHLTMFGGWRDDGDEVHVGRGDELAPVGAGAKVELGGDAFRSLLVLASDRDYAQARFAQSRHLNARTPTGPDNADSSHSSPLAAALKWN
jgi:hypothetical protein